MAALLGFAPFLLEWGHSSVGRAPALQAGCRRFDSVWLHQDLVIAFKFAVGRKAGVH